MFYHNINFQYIVRKDTVTPKEHTILQPCHNWEMSNIRLSIMHVQYL